MSRNSN